MSLGNHPGIAGIGDSGFNAGGRRAARPATGRIEGAAEGDTHGRSLILASVARDARLDSKFLLLMFLSTAIATLGLLQSSTAVVIGAMLVSPLLGPIMGVGFGLAVIDAGLIKRSLITLGIGIALAIAVAVVIIWLSPIKDVTSELRGRTQPTLIDLGVAVVGGIAGVYSIMRKLSGVMVGVAIATALVPPLSTVGFGLATGRMDFALGAGLLFITNTLAIALAATVVARVNKFGPSLTPQHTAMQVVGILAVLGVLAIPLAVSFNNIAREVRARNAVQSELSQMLGKNDRVDTMNVRVDRQGIAVDGVVLVNGYDNGLDQKLSAMLTREFDRPARVNIAQLRQQTNAAVEGEAQLNRRLTQLESREEDSRAILSGLTVGDLIARSAIMMDAQARRVIISRDPATEGVQVSAAMDKIIASVQADHPDWLLQNGRLTGAATPQETAAATGADTGAVAATVE